MTEDGKNRNDIQIGSHVNIIKKEDQHTGRITRGVVRAILTKSNYHPHGIKIRLEDGQVGRIHQIIPQS